MKRFFTKKSVAIIFTTIIILVGFFSFHQALAQDSAQMFMDPPTDSVDGQKAAKVDGENSDQEVSMWTFFSGGVPGIISMFLNNVILPIFALWAGIAGLILDYSIEFSIYSNGFDQIKTSIQAVWVLIRDTANILFIFILLYASIKQIVFGEAAKKVLTTVIISAVLINFSMFFTRVAVDASNMVGTALYNQIEMATNLPKKGALSATKKISDLLSYDRKIDLSGRIVDGLKLNNLSNTVTALKLDISTTILLAAINIVLYVILLWVFIMLAVMILGRFVTLVILLATSPIGFIGGAIPYLGEVSKKWQKSLLDQCLMVPALFFFLLLTLKLARNLTPGNGNMDGSLMINLFNFFLVAFLLFKTVSVTKGFSGEIGKMADKIASGAMLAAGGITVAGLVGAAGTAGGLKGLVSSQGAMAAADAAKLSGKGKIGQWGDRLAFSAKNIGAGVKETGTRLKETVKEGGKFVTGDYEKTGVGGWAKGLAREKIMGGIKTATGGNVDLKAVEKMLSDSKKETKKNLNEKADSFTKGSKEKIKQNEALEDRINKAGAAAATRVVKEKEFIDAEKDLEQTKNKKDILEADTKEKEKVLKKAQTDYKKNPSPVTQAALNMADTEHSASEKLSTQASNDFSHAEAIVENFQRDYAKKQKIEQDKAMEDEAQKMGMIATEFYEAVLDANGNPVIDPETGEKEMLVAGKSFVKAFEDMRADDQTKLTAAEIKRDKFITDNIENGTYWGTLLFGGTRKKFAQEVRARVGSETGDEKSIKAYLKFMKDQKENPSTENKPPTP